MNEEGRASYKRISTVRTQLIEKANTSKDADEVDGGESDEDEVNVDKGLLLASFSLFSPLFCIAMLTSFAENSMLLCRGLAFFSLSPLSRREGESDFECTNY